MRSRSVSATVLATLLLAFALVLASSEAGAAEPPPRPEAEAWILVDALDGERLTARRPENELAIASATKLMTAYVLLAEARLSERFEAPAYEALAVESVLGLEQGERISVRDLVYALVLASANDGAVTAARGVSGSVALFVDDMNAAATELGLENTRFANPIGLDDPANHSSAADLAELARVLLEDAFFRRVADSREHTIATDRGEYRIVSRNELLGRAPWVTGVKTGRTLGAGYVLVGSGERRGTRLIAVVLGAPSETARDEGTLALLEWGFSLYRHATPVRPRQPFAQPPVDSGGTVPLLARRAVRVAAREDQRIETDVEAPSQLAGPIRRGERLGRVTVSVDGRAVGQAPLVAGRAAAAPSVADELSGSLATLALAGTLALVILIAIVAVIRVRRNGSRAAGRR